MTVEFQPQEHGDSCRCEACCGERYAERNRERLAKLNIKDEDWARKVKPGAQRHSASTGDWAEYLEDK